MKPIKKSKKPKNDKLVKRVYQPEKHIEIPPAEGVDKYKILEEQKIIRAMVVEKISSTSPMNTQPACTTTISFCMVFLLG